MITNVVPLNTRDWKWHRDRIAEAWGKDQVEAIIEVGRRLEHAKDELGHGGYEPMVRQELPFGLETARQYRAIASHAIISNPKHVRDLPPSWGTLFKLTKLPDDILLARIKDGSINPKLERKDVAALKPGAKEKPKSPSREELIAAIQKDPTANQREAAAALGVSLGMYQRTRNELIGSGDIAGPMTLENLRERITAMLLQLPKDERRLEISRIIDASQMNIRDWVSTIEIGLGKKKR